MSYSMSFQEMDLIEVLWKQDVDLGFSLSPPKLVATGKEKETKDDAEKLKVLLELKENKVSQCFYYIYAYRASFRCQIREPLIGELQLKKIIELGFFDQNLNF
jgi:hypothetical protein